MPDDREESTQHRRAALILHSLRGSREITAPASRAFLKKFEDDVDPEGKLTLRERYRRAQLARKAYFMKLAQRSALARQLKGGRVTDQAGHWRD